MIDLHHMTSIFGTLTTRIYNAIHYYPAATTYTASLRLDGETVETMPVFSYYGTPQFHEILKTPLHIITSDQHLTIILRTPGSVVGTTEFNIDNIITQSQHGMYYLYQGNSIHAQIQISFEFHHGYYASF